MAIVYAVKVHTTPSHGLPWLCVIHNTWAEKLVNICFSLLAIIYLVHVLVAMQWVITDNLFKVHEVGRPINIILYDQIWLGRAYALFQNLCRQIF